MKRSSSYVRTTMLMLGLLGALGQDKPGRTVRLPDSEPLSAEEVEREKTRIMEERRRKAMKRRGGKRKKTR